eukprot:m.166100 g.166100  ORF g.166100 m.166100 type:complete len:331 (-) comp9898_c0_seq2:6340-7332(-)
MQRLPPPTGVGPGVPHSAADESAIHAILATLTPPDSLASFAQSIFGAAAGPPEAYFPPDLVQHQNALVAAHMAARMAPIAPRMAPEMSAANTNVLGDPPSPRRTRPQRRASLPRTGASLGSSTPSSFSPVDAPSPARVDGAPSAIPIYSVQQAAASHHAAVSDPALSAERGRTLKREPAAVQSDSDGDGEPSGRRPKTARRTSKSRTKREPVPSDFASYKEYLTEWEQWRLVRDTNNSAVKRSRERKKMADGGPASGSTAADSVQPASIDSGGFDHASELQALRVTVARLMREKALLARRLQDPGSLTPDDLREIAAILAAGAVAPPLQL